MVPESQKIALVYHETGDGIRLPFLNNLIELVSLVEPNVSCELFPFIRLLLEKQKHTVSKVVVFLFGNDTDFPSFPNDIQAYFNIPNSSDFIIVSQRPTTEDSTFSKESIFFAKNLTSNANEWCPEFFQRLFPKATRESIANKDILFVCDDASKDDVEWCKHLVTQIKSLGGQAVSPGTPEWTSADTIMTTIKPTSLVVLVPRKDGTELLMKFGPMIETAKSKAKVVIATKNAEKTTTELKGKMFTLYSREQPIDFWLGIMCHLEMVSCKINTGADQDDSQSGFIMPFAKQSVKTAEGCKWSTVLIVVLVILFMPIIIALALVWIVLGCEVKEKRVHTY